MQKTQNEKVKPSSVDLGNSLFELMRNVTTSQRDEIMLSQRIECLQNSLNEAQKLFAEIKYHREIDKTHRDLGGEGGS